MDNHPALWYRIFMQSQNRTKRVLSPAPAKPAWTGSQNTVSKQIGYVRVSTNEQTLDQQLDALKAAGCHAIYADHGLSGADRNRAGLAGAMADLRAGDCLVIWRLDRLARSARHLLEIADTIRERGCELRSLRENLDTSTASGKLVYAMFAAFAEFEHDVNAERTAASLAAKKRRGERIGRKPKLTAADVAEARVMMADGKSAQYVANRLRCGRATLFRHLRTTVSP